MPLEIERKFLVSSFEFKSLAKPILIQQGFLNDDKERTVRVRIMGDQAYLTIKTKNRGVIRNEFEYLIPYEEAKILISDVCLKPLISKNRYIIKIKNSVWEVDEFLDDNKGLIIAEIELSDEYQGFTKPSWIGKEVSDDKRYYNSYLVKHPFSCWKNNDSQL